MSTGTCRLGRRALRWATLATTLPALWACNSRSLEAPTVKPDQTHVVTFKENVNRKIDILFMIDNSPSMQASQDKLLNNFPVFMDVLTKLPGGLPSVQIAVVSSDLGAGVNISAQCHGNGDAAIFQARARANCQTTLPEGAHFISNLNGVANYTAPIEQVFTCLAALGDDGCGFEQPLLSAAYALGAFGAPPSENAGFLRDDAYLAIILITNEDDCSGPNGAASPLFSDSYGTLASTLGPPRGYRCNEFGHLCGSPLAPPPRLAPNGDVKAKVTLDGCVPAEDQGMLIPVATFATAIKQLKPDPDNQILVAAITGPTTPYTVSWADPPTTDGPWPVVDHSCVATATSYADPAVRISDWVKQFHRNGVLQSICDDDFRFSMTRIADEIGRVIGPQCVNAAFADRDGDPSNGLQYDCTALAHASGATDVPVPACADAPSARPCWRLTEDDGCKPAAESPTGAVSRRLIIDRNDASQPEVDVNIDLACAVCTPGIADPRCR